MRERDPAAFLLSFLERYRHLSLLVGVLLAQLFFLAFQIRGENEVRLLRVWAVAAITPVERALHAVGEAGGHLWTNYLALYGVQQERQRLEAELDRARLRLQELEAQAAEAEQLAQLLELKQSSYAQSEAVAAEVIGMSAASNARSLDLNRGRDAGLGPNMVVVTPDGVVGKVITVFPRSAQVLLITDPRSGVGAMTSDSRILGVLKGTDGTSCRLDYVPNEESVPVGSKLITSGQDQIFPKGLPLGAVTSVRPGDFFQEVSVRPAARLTRLEYVLVLVRPAHSVAAQARVPEGRTGAASSGAADPR